jgi:hypothetical protein
MVLREGDQGIKPKYDDSPSALYESQIEMHSTFVASRHIRKMRGGAQAHLIEDTEGHFHVVKFINNPQHRRILINEWIGSALLRHLNISTPSASLIDVDQYFLDNNPGAYMEFTKERRLPSLGSHFASRYPADSSRMAVYDFLPDPLLNQVDNLRDFLGVLVLDKWTSNADARQALFVRLPSDNRFSVQMLDQGFIFGGPSWHFLDSPIHGAYFRPRVYGDAHRLTDFEPWLTMVENLSPTVLEDAVRGIPMSWLKGDESEIWRLTERLFRRRQRVASLIDHHLRCRPLRTMTSNEFVPKTQKVSIMNYDRLRSL